VPLQYWLIFLLLFGDGISNVRILNAVIIWLESMVSVQ